MAALFLLIIWVPSYTALRSSYLNLHQNTIVDDQMSETIPEITVRSEIECSSLCHFQPGCCASSYEISTGRCILDFSSLCESRFVHAIGWITHTLANLSTTGNSCHDGPHDCEDIRPSSSGEYMIYPGCSNGVNVWCNVTSTDPYNVWTVIQRRFDGSVDFYRNWESYKTGFGTTQTEYWIGNDALHELTNQDPYLLRIELTDWDNVTKYADYATFHVDDEKNLFKLTISEYSGTAGDSMFVHDGQPFSTFDNDNDELQFQNCAEDYEGAWWYYSCFHANLNALYKQGVQPPNSGNVMAWAAFHGQDYSLKSCTMMVQRLI